MTTAADLVHEILTDLKNPGGIEPCAIASRDGLLINSDMPEGVVGQNFAVMSATILGATETAAIELNKGLYGRVIVE